MSLFPFTIYPSREHGSIPHGFRDLFQKQRKPDVIWYAADVIVNSDTEIEFVVYDMKDMCYGGIGKEIYRMSVTVEQSDVIGPISREALRQANDILLERKRQKHLLKVNALALELMDAEMDIQ